MRVVRTVAEVRALRRPRARIGLVPTMGAFHDGHLSLMSRARKECDVLVVSLFVNAPQFDEAADLKAYPRDEHRDGALAAQAGVDVLFVPDHREVYPEGFSTTVSVGGISERLEGESRGRAHFDAVATVVCKLLNMVGPDVAYFGAKDAQQVLLIQRMVRDLDIPVRVEVCPTVREADGLALSSRNTRLSAEERERATALHRALGTAADAVRAGERDAQAVSAAARAELEHAGVQTEYFELVDTGTLAPVTRIDEAALALVAARIGETRLIDNQTLFAIPMAESSHHRSH